LPVPTGGRRVQVQHSVRHLVEQILAEPPAPFERRLELGRLRVVH
jgi:hypothetical protein